MEGRRLLSGDFPGWQNLLVPTDVNNDGVVSSLDVLLVANELYMAGSRMLAPPAAAVEAGGGTVAADDGPVGEGASRNYLDVNGDNYLTPADVLLVVRHLFGADPTDVVAFRLETTTLTGTPVSSVDLGESFFLDVFVQDIRPDTVPDRGVGQAYVDVTFDDVLVTPLGPFTFGAAYQEQTSGSLATPGLVDEAGGTQTGFGVTPPFQGPLGPGEFLLFRVPFQATTVGTVTFQANPADDAIFHDVVLFTGTITVPNADIDFGSVVLTVNPAQVIAVDDDLTVDEDSGATQLAVLDNDVVNSGGTLVVVDVGAANRGGTVVNQGDHLLYTPAQDFWGTETFTYTIEDGLGHSSVATVTMTVNPVNDDPVAHDDGGLGFATSENAAFATASALANDTDVDGDTLVVLSINTTGTLGVVTDNGDGTFGYNPNGVFDYLGLGQTATDFLTYVVSDGNGGTDTATVAITINGISGEGSVQFRLETTDLLGTPIPDISQGESFLLNVYVQDIRPATVPDRGVFQAFVDVTFDSVLATAVGPLTFGTYYGMLNSGSLATPGLVDEAGGVDTDFGLQGPLGPGEFLLFSLPFDALIPGTVTFASNPADDLVYHPVLLFEPPGTVPADDIVFGTASLAIHAGPVAAIPDAFTVDEDTSGNFLDVLLNDEINTGGTLVITGVGATDNGGGVVNNGDHLLYAPLGDFTGIERFTYTIGDGLGNTGSTTVTVTVRNVNDAPVAHDDGGPQFTTSHNTASTTGNVLANDTDIDGDTLSVFSLDTAGTRGLVTNNGNGTFGYDPNGQFDYLGVGQTANDVFRYTVTDGNSAFDTATVTITITGVPPTPGRISGFVYADVDNDGQKDAVERAIGGVEVRLEGTDLLGSPVSLSTVTDALGAYRFTDVLPGNYELVEVQPKFYLDGFDTVAGVLHTGPNDRIAITPATNVADLKVNFGERSLHPEFIVAADFSIPPLPREGVEIGFDSAGNQLWYSLLDGWDGVTSVHVRLDGTTATVTAYGESLGTLNFTVAMPSRDMFLKGQTSEGAVVRIVGTLASLAPPAPSPLAAGTPFDPVDEFYAELGSEEYSLDVSEPVDLLV